MGITNTIESDNAPLVEMVQKLLNSGVRVHVLRDVTRGGLATVLKELAVSSGQMFELFEDALPVDPQVRDFCGLLGLDPLYMGNEGKMVAIVAAEDAERALSLIQSAKYGANARVIGEVQAPHTEDEQGRLVLRTRIGGRRSLDVLQGEGLPRIC
jgi:hydrogenase expression/formation protein HypE